jgi:hypothetical protein
MTYFAFFSYRYSYYRVLLMLNLFSNDSQRCDLLYKSEGIVIVPKIHPCGRAL